MSQSVIVGLLAEAIAEDPEIAAEQEVLNEKINTVLVGHNLPKHKEPRQLPEDIVCGSIDSFSYASLPSLMRFYAYAIESEGQPPTIDESLPFNKDPVILKVINPKHHLIYHGVTTALFVPADIEEVLDAPELPGGKLGSTQRLMEELTAIAPALGVEVENGELTDKGWDALTDEPFEVEKAVWSALFEGGQISLKYNTLLQVR